MASSLPSCHRYRPVKRSCWSELYSLVNPVSALPLILIWNNRCRYSLLDNCEPQGSVFAAWRSSYWRVYGLGTDSFAGYPAEESGEGAGVDLPSYGGVVANSYLPSNGFRHWGCMPGRGSMNLPIIIIA